LSPLLGVQGFCFGQLGEGRLEVEEGDQGLFLLLCCELELDDFCPPHMLLMDGLELAGALAPNSFQVSCVCRSFKSDHWLRCPF